jgi:zinc D-Ala-D-Ala carboxypeptidase
MNAELLRATGKDLVIASGYRSGAYQVVLILHELVLRRWNLDAVLSVLEPPGKSEHNRPVFHAIDVFDRAIYSTDPNVKVLKAFEESERFGWLRLNAPRFGFSLSYPENNTRGKIFEPWHWLYEGSSESQTPAP